MGPYLARIRQWLILWTSSASLMSNFAFILSVILHEGARAYVFLNENEERCAENKALAPGATAKIAFLS